MVRAESSKRAASSNGSWSSARSASRSSKLSGHITSTISRSPFAHTSDPLSECRRTRCQPQILAGRNRDNLGSDRQKYLRCPRRRPSGRASSGAGALARQFRRDLASPSPARRRTRSRPTAPAHRSTSKAAPPTGRGSCSRSTAPRAPWLSCRATYIQVSEFTVRGAQAGKPLADLSIPKSYRWVPPAVPAGLPFNVAQLYKRMAEGIRERKSLSPAFDVAVKRHQLLDVIQKASDTGIRQIF